MPKSTKTSTSKDPASPFVRVGECLYRHRSSRVYYALVKRSGKQLRRSLKTTDPALAKRRLGEFREKVGLLSKKKNAAEITFDALARKWLESVQPHLKPKSYLRRENSVNQLRRFIGTLTIKQLSISVLEEWARRRGEGVAASTYNNERETIIAVLDYAKRDGLLLDNPAKLLKRRKMPRHAVQIPTKAQFSKMVETMRGLGPRFIDAVDLVELLAYSGMRRTEATSIRWQDINFENDRFTVTGGEAGTKNHEARVVPLFPTLRCLLKKLYAEKNPNQKDCISNIGTATKALATACKKADVPRYHHHAMRHFFVSNAIEQGIDFKTIAEWIGHKDGGLLVAKTYGHLRDTHSVEMAKRMTFSA